MNLPNLLSLFRLFITVFFILLIMQDRYRIALALFILQGISDLLDGFFARRMGIKTALGAYLDPLADKVMLASSYLVLSFKSLVPFWLMTTIITRDIVVSLGFFLLHRLSIRVAPSPSYLGKATTAAQIVTVIYVLWFLHSPYEMVEMVFFYATAILTGLSGIQYIFLGYNALFRKEIV